MCDIIFLLQGYQCLFITLILYVFFTTFSSKQVNFLCLNENNFEKIKLTKLLNQVYLMIDWNRNNPEKEKLSIYNAAMYLNVEVDKIKKNNASVLLIFIL